MNYAFWFSRHEPTDEQLASIARAKRTLVGISEGRALGKKSLKTAQDVNDVLLGLSHLMLSHKAYAANERVLYGVFPAPLRERFVRYRHEGLYEVLVYEAWNVNRADEGSDKPSFEFKRWCFTDWLYLPM